MFDDAVTLEYVFSFQKSWTKSKSMLENSVKTVSAFPRLLIVLLLVQYNLILVVLFSLFIYCFLVMGPVESDPEYRLIVAANNLTVEIENELSE